MHRRTVLKAAALAPIAFPTLLAAASAPSSAPRTTAPPAPAGRYTMDPLPYPFDALEPFIDARTMEIHYSQHHAGYVAALNRAVSRHPEIAARSPIDLISHLESVPEDIRLAVRNFGGGHVNHSLFWSLLKRNGGLGPSGPLMELLVKDFGTFADFQKEFTDRALGVFGSGWLWISMAPSGQVGFEATANQDSPYMSGRVPLLGIDLWEHAYYLKYQNHRADYVAAFLHVINWEQVGQRLTHRA